MVVVKTLLAGEGVEIQAGWSRLSLDMQKVDRRKVYLVENGKKPHEVRSRLRPQRAPRQKR